MFWQKKKPLSVKTPIEVETLKPGRDDSVYSLMFDTMTIRVEWRDRINAAAIKMLSNRARYESVQQETQIPWYFIGCIHLLESSCNFKTHLHNGDPLTARTIHVPVGFPRYGTPPFSWEESAMDALSIFADTKGFKSLGFQFHELERYNGFGYRKKGIYTPYLWSGSNHYTAGKFMSDGHYDPIAKSSQVGAACIYRYLEDRGIL